MSMLHLNFNLTKSSFDIKQKHIHIKSKDNALEGFKILQISDLHIDTHRSETEIKDLILFLNSIPCHILVITGDLLACNVTKIEKKLILFKNLKHPTYFVSGNHDLVHGYKKLYTILSNCRIKILHNEFEIIEHNKTKILVAGLSDRFSKFFKIKRSEQIFIDTIKAKKLPTIFLAHQPKDYTYALQVKSELFLCGHTHGGQIYPFNYLVRLIQPFVSGLYHIKNMPIYVNNGLGTWGIRYRYKADAEITLFNL